MKILYIVSKCTITYFMSDTASITLHTDASDYGVDGYLFQTVDGVNHPIVSKSFTSAQLRWSVMQKEAHENNYSCMYLEYLLKDHPFKIRRGRQTDTHTDTHTETA